MSAALGSRRASLKCLLMLGAAALSGCQSLPAAREAPLRHSGRLSVLVDGDSDRSFSAGFELRGTPQAGSLALASALGTLLGRAQWSSSGVSLLTPDGRTEYASLEAMTEQLMGEPIPLLALFDWLDLAAARTDAVPARVPPGWQLEPIVPGSGRVIATREQPAPRVRLRVVLDRSAS